MRCLLVGLICWVTATSVAGCERRGGDGGAESGTDTWPAAVATSAPPARPEGDRPQRRPGEHPPLSDDRLARERRAAEPDVDPAAGSLELMWVKGKWAVWRWRALVESTRAHRGRSWFYKFYLQRLNEQTAKFVVKYVGPPFGPSHFADAVAVTDDGTLIWRGMRSDLEWRSRDGGTTRNDMISNVSLPRIDVDGALWKLRSTTGKDGWEIAGGYRFLPFAGSTYDPKQFVELAPPGIDYLRFKPPVRYKNEFAWSQDRTVHFVDIKTGKRRTSELKAPQVYHASHFEIRMFDDQVIAGPLNCFDAATGEMLGERDPHESERRAMGMFALHDGIGYFYSPTTPQGYAASRRITAADLRAAALEFVEFSPMSHGPIGSDEHGLLLWTATEWKHLPWLKAIPPDAPRVNR